MGVATTTPETSSQMTLENLAEFPEGRRVLTCIQCGLCAGTCPYGDVMAHFGSGGLRFLHDDLVDGSSHPPGESGLDEDHRLVGHGAMVEREASAILNSAATRLQS
jgi:ferredoxin